MANVILWNSIGVRCPTRSLGAYQLASWLRLNGYTVKVIDFCNFMSVENLVKITEKHISNDTLSVGVSNTFWQNDGLPVANFIYTEPLWVISSRKQIEQQYPNIKWTMGGARTHLIQSNNWVKFYGNGEDDYLKWLDSLSNQKFKFRKIFDIKTSFNKFQDDDHIQSHEVIPIELGRGCMFKCKFCAYDKIGKIPGTYSRNYECIKKEILDHYNRWGTTRFYYIDDTVNENEIKVQALTDIAQSVPFNLEWIGYIRADLVWSKPKTEQLLIDSGLKSAFFGIESFELKSSQLVGKGWSGKHAKEWLLEKRQKWKHDITWQMGLIVGIPGQTVEQLRQDHEWLIKNDMHNWTFFPLWLEPGTYQSEFSKNATKYGFVFPEKDINWLWKNEYWDSMMAIELANKLNEESINYKKIAAWELGEYASMGYDFSEVMSSYRKDVNTNDILKKITQFIDNYIQESL